VSNRSPQCWGAAVNELLWFELSGQNTGSSSMCLQREGEGAALGCDEFLVGTEWEAECVDP
jgi:hypothetical protein